MRSASNSLTPSLTSQQLIEDIKTSFFSFEVSDPDVIDEARVDFRFKNRSILNLNFVKEARAGTLGIGRCLGRRQGTNNVQRR